MPGFVWHATSLILLELPYGEGSTATLGVLKIEISVLLVVSCFGEREIRKGEKKMKRDEEKGKKKKQDFPHGTQFLVSSKPPKAHSHGPDREGVPPVLTISELSLF